MSPPRTDVVPLHDRIDILAMITDHLKAVDNGHE